MTDKTAKGGIPGDDVALGKLLVARGLVTEAQVLECTQLMMRGSADPTGRPLQLADYLLRKGYVSLEDVQNAIQPTTAANPITGATQAVGASSARMPPEVSKVAQEAKRRLGKYILMNEVGRGGMGAVYRAWDSGLNRWVAVKVLMSETSAADLQRFLREAETAASLAHPNIAAIYDVGSQDGKHFIAMQFIEGKIIAGAKQPPQRAADIIKTSALALEHAHRMKIIHRDIKPHNIMVDKQGRVYVLDFGIARTKGQSHLTATGVALGTPSYMSPEQGAGLDTNKLSDVYSLGATLYELVTGKPPFKGQTPLQTVMMVVNRDPKPPSAVNPAVPRSLELVILKCMEKDPHRRYSTAQALADDLGRFLKGEQVLAQPPTVFTRLGKQLKRHRISMAVGGAALVVVIAVIASLAGTKVDAGKVQGLVEMADKLFDGKKYAEAMGLYNQAIGLDDKDSRVRAQIRLCQKKIDEISLAERKAKEEADRRRKEAEDREKQTALAGPEIEKGKEKLDQAERDLYRPGADLPSSRVKAAEAIDHFTKALGFSPNHGDALYYRGRAHLHRLDYPKAEADFAKAIEHHPEFAPPRVARGRLHILRWIECYVDCGGGGYSKTDPGALREKDLALADFAAAAKAGVKDKQDTFDAMIRFAEGNMAECMMLCDKILARSDTDEEIHKLRGDAYFFSAQIDSYQRFPEAMIETLNRSIAAYDKSIQLRVNFPEARAMRGYVKSLLGRRDEAIADFQEALKIDEGNFLALFMYAGAIDNADDPKVLAYAEELYTRILKIKPDSYFATTNRGILRTRVDKTAEAMKDLDAAIKLRPTHVWALQAKGGLLGRMKQWAEAEIVLNQALDLDPTNPTIWYNRGAVRGAQGKTDSAIADFQEAIRRGHPQPAQCLKAIDLVKSQR